MSKPMKKPKVEYWWRVRERNGSFAFLAYRTIRNLQMGNGEVKRSQIEKIRVEVVE